MTETEVLNLVASNKAMMRVLEIIAEQNLKDSWLAAGAVRNFIWNHLSGRPAFDQNTDLDLVFYDKSVSHEKTQRIELFLKECYPQYQWELKNQFYMHVHSPNTEVYRDTCDAIRKYPEKCTAVAIRLYHGGLQLYAPYGLDDIIRFCVRPTPHFEKDPERMGVYKKRLSQKKWTKKWPQLCIEV
ncbi:nucleotidyltransferase family protein [Streptococcus plurextorum]|uniref:nucleotidyltransferase family protein n=1 Tax=Streptococcus plurextorum TaxID=456876 RepID=UPI0003F8A438|nr:nucleotidyltransferase family protein [Streptococcus plurextorum]